VQLLGFQDTQVLFAVLEMLYQVTMNKETANQVARTGNCIQTLVAMLDYHLDSLEDRPDYSSFEAGAAAEKAKAVGVGAEADAEGEDVAKYAVAAAAATTNPTAALAEAAAKFSASVCTKLDRNFVDIRTNAELWWRTNYESALDKSKCVVRTDAYDDYVYARLGESTLDRRAFGDVARLMFPKMDEVVIPEALGRKVIYLGIKTREKVLPETEAWQASEAAKEAVLPSLTESIQSLTKGTYPLRGAPAPPTPAGSSTPRSLAASPMVTFGGIDPGMETYTDDKEMILKVASAPELKVSISAPKPLKLKVPSMSTSPTEEGTSAFAVEPIARSETSFAQPKSEPTTDTPTPAIPQTDGADDVKLVISPLALKRSSKRGRTSESNGKTGQTKRSRNGSEDDEASDEEEEEEDQEEEEEEVEKGPNVADPMMVGKWMSSNPIEIPQYPRDAGNQLQHNLMGEVAAHQGAAAAAYATIKEKSGQVWAFDFGQDNATVAGIRFAAALVLRNLAHSSETKLLFAPFESTLLMHAVADTPEKTVLAACLLALS
jgi:hypothetical protein